MDSDCAMGINGRCITSMGGPAYCYCTYDTCARDTDCPAGQTCGCHGTPYSAGAGSTCVPGNCRVDRDCGAAGYCSPTYMIGSCGGLGGFYCHTAMDECLDDADCMAGGMGYQLCAYSTTTTRWQCAGRLFCP